MHGVQDAWFDGDSTDSGGNECLSGESEDNSVGMGKEPTMDVYIRHWQYTEPQLFILRTGNEGKEDAGDEATGGTRSWKRKDKEVGEAGPAGTIGRVRRSVPAVSTVNLDKHSHVTLLQAQILKKFSL